MGKKILIIGNGFDLAHSLPTRYSEFIDFCQKVECIWNMGLNTDHADAINDFRKYYISPWKTDESIRSAIEDAFKNRHAEQIDGKKQYTVTTDNAELTEIYNMLDNNIWYKYFCKLLRDKKMRGENWIDFEFEIRLIIEEVDRNTSALSDKWKNIKKNNESNLLIFALFFHDCIMKRKNHDKENQFTEDKFNDITIKDLRKETYYDLDRLIRALELYLSAFVEKIELKSKIPEIEALDPDFVINFNYTNTYEKNYKKADIHYIHGKADANRSAKDSNLVLGIDEYWPPSECDRHTFFTIFKKFSQRIQKHTGNDCYRYLAEIKKLYDPTKKIWHGKDDDDKFKYHHDGISDIYIFGHSLDITDKDILAGFIGSEAASVTVYCLDKETEGELIANTIKLIGEETLIEKVNSLPTKLRYVIQEQESVCNKILV